MDYYQDIRLLPDDDIPVSFLRNKFFSKFHKTLYDLKSDNIGVSFPEADKKLGKIVRIHSDEASIKRLQEINWLGGLSGYCEFSGILTVPEKVEGYRCISRKRQNMSESKLKRLIRRNSISEEEAKSYRAKMLANGLELPFLELRSVSTNKLYRIYIDIGKLLDTPKTGKFNHYGFSNEATIPVF